MKAEIIQTEQGYTAEFIRHLAHPIQQVWAMLTENDKLQQWFDELTIEDLRKGGSISFNMGDGNFERMEILEYEEGKLLAFEWAEDQVAFQLQGKNDSTMLTMVEKINRMTPQTAKDLAGWHVCLDVIESLLDGKAISRTTEWKREYPEYKRLLSSMTVEFE